jgi:hypothetical protein
MWVASDENCENSKLSSLSTVKLERIYDFEISIYRAYLIPSKLITAKSWFKAEISTLTIEQVYLSKSLTFILFKQEAVSESQTLISPSLEPETSHLSLSMSSILDMNPLWALNSHNLLQETSPWHSIFELTDPE